MNIEDFLPNENKFLKMRDNKLLLTDYQISVLNQNGIDYMNYKDYKALILDIERVISDGEDSEELEIVSEEISELYYYNFTNK